MRSRRSARVRLVAVAALWLAAGAARAGEPLAPANGAGPTDAEVADAIARVRADPNLATDRTIKTLKWRPPSDSKPLGTPAWLQWIGGLFRWLDQSARALVWGAAAVLAGLLVVYVARVVRATGVRRPDETFVAPTHVRDLDIRPDTLPRDIGAAARALWDRGEHRAALALLYRGLLSRLAHVHGVPIRESTTEGDCLTLAAGLAPRRREYVGRLVNVWQRAVYGREDVPAAGVYELCDGFAGALDAAAARIGAPAEAVA